MVPQPLVELWTDHLGDGDVGRQLLAVLGILTGLLRGLGQVQLEVNFVGQEEGSLGVVRYSVPDQAVGNVDGSEQVGRRAGVDSPEICQFPVFS